jgi:hypothetical protein
MLNLALLLGAGCWVLQATAASNYDYQSEFGRRYVEQGRLSFSMDTQSLPPARLTV